ncbi:MULTISPECIES: hypothetical protein [Streptosporangium]|uniref:Uncharacterized membrane protein HdeD (DUF308 family) n=1 Tax=Streptosporangium brasiliense TaxID=47480 RepID=A0ABT9R128_9ACTN|nr:hypothetical protein [Streptosporangium brasiliense]MDP9862938.1 uncharacterized membrane protein HdeD (DUF308 family) [Streptosporangium brasiliense]
MRPEIERTERGGRHRTDWMALLSGVLFIAVGTVFISRPAIEPMIMLPVVLGGLGFAGLAAILARAFRR